MNPEIENKAKNAMFLLFESVLNEAKEEKKESSIANVKELYLPSVDKRLITSSELLCKIPPRHIETIKTLRYHALCFFETCGLKREFESKYLEALPAKLRPKPFNVVAKETLDESCLEKPCQLCESNDDGDCEFIKELKVLLKSEQFKNGIIRLLKHQKDSSDLSQEEEQAASRLNEVEIKCMETVQVHLVVVKTNEVLKGSSMPRKSFVVKRADNDAWTLYMKHGVISSNLAKSINKILDWRIKEEFLLAISGMLSCNTPLEIPGILNEHDIKVDAGKNDEVKLGSEVPVVFHQLLEQNPLFVFHAGERVVYCTKLPDDGNQDDETIKYILAEIIRCVKSNPAEGEYDFEARFLIDIGSEQKEVSVLDLYKFYQDYPDENSCTDLVPFTGDVAKKPETYDEAKREILKALRAAWRLPPDLRRKAIHRLYLLWHPDKNLNNPEFAAEMMKFLLEQIERMKQEDKRLGENFDFDEMVRQCDRQASRDNATFYNYRSHSSFSTSGFRFNSDMFHSAEAYTTPNPREAKRWIEQAEGDLSTCQWLRTARKPFDAIACFESQQIVEKSLKAALYYECGLANEQLHTHDVYSLATDVNNLKRWKNHEVVSLASGVAKYYLPTRYPNQLSYPMVPHNSFDGKSEHAIRSAAEVLRLVKEFTRR
jgi:sacsin